MTQFEKCWAEKVTGYDENNPAHRVNKATAKQFWSGALRWARATHDYIIREELLNNQTDNSTN